MSSKAFTLLAVKAKANQVLHLAFADGAEFDVDLSKIIAKHPTIAALADPATFKRAKVAEWKDIVTWGTDDLELAADNLRARAVEQAGGFSHEGIVKWMHQHKLTQIQAAEALGMDVSTVSRQRKTAVERLVRKYIRLHGAIE